MMSWVSSLKSLDETKHHVELCEEMLRAAGGDPDDTSPGADAVREKAESLLSVQVPQERAELNSIENLVLAETKDHWNWEMLAKKAKSIKDHELKTTIGRAVRELGRQERDHLKWATETLTELAEQMSEQSAESPGGGRPGRRTV